MFGKKKNEEMTVDLNNDEIVELEDLEQPKQKEFSILKFIFKIVIAVLLISFAILLFIKQEESFFIIFITTASIVLLVGIIRIVSLLVKKEENDKVKKLVLILSAIHASIAIYLIIAGIIYNKEYNDHGLSQFSKWNEKNYPMFLAAILYSESVGYFMNTSLFKKDSSKLIFWLHIAFITIAVLILSLGNNFTGGKMIRSLAIISLVCAALTIVDASVGLYKYSKQNKQEESDDKKEDNNEFKELDTKADEEDNEDEE